MSKLPSDQSENRASREEEPHDSAVFFGAMAPRKSPYTNVNLKGYAYITEDYVSSMVGKRFPEHIIVMAGTLRVWERSFSVLRVNGKLYLSWGECIWIARQASDKNWDDNEVDAQTQTQVSPDPHASIICLFYIQQHRSKTSLLECIILAGGLPRFLRASTSHYSCRWEVIRSTQHQYYHPNRLGSANYWSRVSEDPSYLCPLRPSGTQVMVIKFVPEDPTQGHHNVNKKEEVEKVITEDTMQGSSAETKQTTTVVKLSGKRA
ncbi:hypothetical protein BaRGS_00039422 [Batillaria attramentaria]|uniref:Uncharacterized protein n=1 Tax=Batillaria attramentaria TaxID=370345 RepID=A0ABD0J310_9CAEN